MGRDLLNRFRKKDLSTTQSKGSGKGLDNVWAAIRRLNARLDAAEAKLNVVQTTAMRTEKKVYREKETVAPPETLAHTAFEEALFGR